MNPTDLKAAKVIECKGSPYEMGRQYAEAARGDLLRSANRFYSLFENSPLGVRRSEVADLGMRFYSNAREFDSGILAFIRGKADALGADFEEIFSLHAMIEVAFNFNNVKAMCSSVSGRRQMRPVGQVKPRRAALNTAEQQMAHGIEGDGVQPQRLFDGGGDFGQRKGLQQS
jgi:hypothetical protein